MNISFDDIEKEQVEVVKLLGERTSPPRVLATLVLSLSTLEKCYGLPFSEIREIASQIIDKLEGDQALAKMMGVVEPKH